MLFSSYEYLFFLPIVFILYWFVFKSIKLQNILLLVVSYFFYGLWDYRFLTLIVFSSLIDYYSGLRIEKSTDLKSKKPWLLLSMFVNLGALGFFKYFNFFAESLVTSLDFLGVEIDQLTLNVVLPVGISFYTFQTMSYTIDVYRGKLKAENDIISFFTFVSFFPQLVAGPIERASNLLPQFKKSRLFDPILASNGMKLILWGLFKKMVIADYCAPIVNTIFASYESLGPVDLIYGAVLFAFQIYGDFSGYSDIAIGSASLLGFTLMVNFKTPYFSKDIAEFWRRWHISLSSWFKDYLYFPLGGSRVSKLKSIRNIFIIFIVSGFWHGANWTFVIWGFLNALYFMPSFLLNTNRKSINVESEFKYIPNLNSLFKILSTFGLTCFAWIFFRANTVSDAFGYIFNIFNFDNLAFTNFNIYTFVIIPFMLVVDWFIFRHEHGLQSLSNSKWWLRYPFYLIIIVMIMLFSPSDGADFIYFQF